MVTRWSWSGNEKGSMEKATHTIRFVTEKGVHVPAVDSAQMREVDRIAVEETGPSLYQMMENAGRNLALLAIQSLDERWRRSTRWTLTLALPKTGLLPRLTGDLYPGEVGIPDQVYRRIGIKYVSPFGPYSWVRLRNGETTNDSGKTQTTRSRRTS